VKRLLIIIVVSALGLTAVPASLFAEPYVSVYAGGSLVPHVRTKYAGVPAPDPTQQINPDASPIFGAKLGYYANDIPFLGIEFDFSYMAPNVPRQRIDATGPTTYIDEDINFYDFGFNALLRWPLYYHKPRLAIEPYVGIGVGFYFMTIDDSVSGIKDKDSGAALHALGGAKLRLTNSLYLFSEYKYILAYTEAKKQGFDMDFQFHNLYGGLEYRFGHVK
jgi:opacity protein-like surface antigen